MPVTQEVSVGGATAVAVKLGADVLAVARAGEPFSAAEVEVLEHLGAQGAVSLDNLRLHDAERAAAAAVRELSTPVLSVRERLLIVPLVGSLDSDRARQLSDALLSRIRTGRALVVVIDVTGVPVIDTAVANQLVQMVAACGLLGARVVVTGLSSEITQALVTAGVDLRAVRAVADLQRGIEEAERLLGEVAGSVDADGDDVAVADHVVVAVAGAADGRVEHGVRAHDLAEAHGRRRRADRR